MPMTRSTAAVAIFSDSGAAVLNGYSTTTTVARPTIHRKKTSGRGVLTRSRCASAARGSGRILHDRVQGLPSPAGLDAHHDLRAAVDQVEQAVEQGQGDRADVRAGEEHDAERDGHQPTRNEQRAGACGFAAAEAGEDLGEATGERPDRHD